MSDRPKTVWVLGSGFSKGLGGPLLADLLSEKRRAQAADVFKRLPDRGRIYQLFRNFGPNERLRYWENAEEFLEIIDLAAADVDGPEYKLIRRLYVREFGEEPEVQRLRDLVALSVAAECSSNVETASINAEAWQPYRYWAKRLERSDTILTFNYDLVLEKLGRDPQVRNLGDETVVWPKQNMARVVPSGTCHVYKLHGSADWAFDDKHPTHPFLQFGSLDGFNFNDGYRPLIATPGATKQAFCSDRLDDLWGAAAERLREADVVVFMGYRFPPSDSYARTRLLGALSENKKPYVRVHTVLGPNLNEPDSVRLVALLRQALASEHRRQSPYTDTRPVSTETELLFDVVPQPLYVQDFLTVLNDTELFGRPSRLEAMVGSLGFEEIKSMLRGGARG
jgi:hypothetical protein